MIEAAELEKRSSAVTLSDMEVFVFPELIYSLVLANIMSPRIWRWRGDPWFSGVDKMRPYRRITRLKQYIMDHYAFNLDLDTWGLTVKSDEIRRFEPFIDVQAIRQANALFGYEGDKYYFDIDIRTHFGLDKYEGDIIPYWKTETVEAMDAFRHKPGHATGAGECVSLATLYAAALFVVARIPLDQIYLMATPLHSQNFIDVDDGILTNNRRLVTKNMWFNGTALSAQARRALENECVTIVAHETGYVHTVYPQATIAPEVYARFSERLGSYLRTELSEEVFGSFLRHNHGIQRCFQLRWSQGGTDRYIVAERAFDYEHGSPYLLTDNTREKLFADMDMEEFQHTRIPGRIVMNDLEAFVRENSIDLDSDADVNRLRGEFGCDCFDADVAIGDLTRFCHVRPKLPEADGKQFIAEAAPLGLDIEMSREEIAVRLESIRGQNGTATMAFYAYRDLNRTEAEPFVKAAVQRNPVCIEGGKAIDDEALAEQVAALPAESIYDEPGRLAQPDEVWNYGRGDGVEKALLLAAVLHARHPEREIVIDVGPAGAELHAGGGSRTFPSGKQLRPQRWDIGRWPVSVREQPRPVARPRAEAG